MKKLFNITALITLLLTLSISASEVSEDCLAKYNATVDTAQTILEYMEKQEYNNVFTYNEILKASIGVSKEACRYEGMVSLGLEGLENQSHMIDNVLSKLD